MTKEANLRAKVDAEGNYKVKGKLPTGTAVLAIKAGSPKQSNFKAGWWTNEHTWVKLTDPATDYKDAAIMEQPSGWVEDGKLGEIEGSIQSSWKSGDKLYGSHEARDSLLKLAYKANEKVQADKYATVDLVHEALGKDADDQEIAAYRKGFVSHARSEKRVWGYDDKTRNLCKYGLAHYTADHKIHFMLDGLDATRVVPAKGGDTKTFTNSEIRAIMRQRMADLGLAGGKKQGINLQNIVFYLGHQPVPAPWDSKAPSAWHQAWKGYVKYRADKGKKKKEEQEEEDDDND